MEIKGKVLLTGVTGFLGLHLAIRLLEKGYEVTGTLRNIQRTDATREIIAAHTSKVERLKLVQADLLDKPIWAELTKGVDFVQHVASPFPRELPKHEDELVIPAREGTLNILRAASANRVKRVVLTSSTAAVIYGKEKNYRKGTFDESDWTDIANKKDTTPYFRSKTIAEKAAWNFIKDDRSGLELATVCPGAILGPVLEKDFGTSANIVVKTLNGSMPAMPDIGFDIVDVRSVADLHILAMEKPEAANQRFIGSAGYLKFIEIAKILKEIYPDKKIPRKVLPDFLIRFFSSFDPALKPVLIDLGTERKVEHRKAEQLLGWKPLSNREAVAACAKSVIELGLV